MGKIFLRRNLVPSFFERDYKKHLASNEWKGIRQRLFAERGKKCERCASTDEIEVHHKTYERLGKEEPDDLLILCEACHEKEHAQKASARYLEKKWTEDQITWRPPSEPPKKKAANKPTKPTAKQESLF
jgi:5-methylcytosine-specific restriction endonuclease McrA